MQSKKRIAKGLGILKIWDADFPWDIRVDKISRTLHREGFDLHLICRNLKRRPPEESFSGVCVHRLFPLGGRRINTISSFPFFLNPFWILRAFGVLRSHNISLILVRDLPMAPAAILLGKVCRITVILDMAENYPAMLRDRWREGGMSLGNLFIRNPSLARIVERITLRYVDHVIVVIEESRNRLVRLGVPPEKISIVRNTPDLEYFRKIKGHARKRRDEDLTLIYVGGLQKGRGLSMVLEALARIVRIHPRISLVVLGDGGEISHLRQLAVELGIERNVQFKGWIDFTEVPSYIHGSDIGIIPHGVTENTNTTIPNKLFDYMAMGKPVVAGNAYPLERIIREENCGEIFDSGDIRSLVRAILSLRDPSRRRHLGDNGRRAVELRYNWTIDARTLTGLVELMGQARPGFIVPDQPSWR